MFIQVAKAASIISDKADTAEKNPIIEFIIFIYQRIDSWILSIVLVILAIYLAKLCKKIVVNKISNQVDDAHEDIIILAGRTTYAGILALGITIALKVAGIDVTAIIAAVGFGIGFALQDLIMNFIAGILILLNHPFKLGDCVSVNGTKGKVIEIQTRSTILQAFDGTRVVVPNSDLINKQIVSYTSNPFRRITIPVYIDYDADINKAKEICMQIVRNNPLIVKEPKPSIIFKDYGDYTLDLSLNFWVDSKARRLRIKGDVMAQILKDFDAAGIEIPYQTMTVQLDNANKHIISKNNANNEDINNPIEKVNIVKVEPISSSEASNLQQSLPNVENKEKSSYLQQDFVLPEVERKPKDLKGADFLSVN
jgi:small-conductance mechanosensitive channel